MQLPKYADLEKFSAGRCTALEGTEALPSGVTGQSDCVKNRNQKTKRTLVASKVNGRDKCACCSEDNRVYACSKFKKLTPGGRLDVASQSSLCFNCSSPFHMADSCKSTHVYQLFSKNHNTFLHLDKGTISADIINHNQDDNIRLYSSQQEPSKNWY